MKLFSKSVHLNYQFVSIITYLLTFGNTLVSIITCLLTFGYKLTLIYSEVSKGVRKGSVDEFRKVIN